MGTTKEGDSTYFLRATVPPLQVGQVFCFSLKPRLAPSTAEMSILGANIGQQILSSVPDVNGQCLIDVPTFAAWLGKALGLNPAQPRDQAIVAQLTPGAETIEAAFVSSVQGPCFDFQAARTTYGAMLSALVANPGDANAQAGVKAAAATLATNLQYFKAAIPGIFTDAVRRAIVVSVMDINLSSFAGQGATPSAANFGSVDVGAFIAFPTGGSQSATDVWLVPYLGLNIYTTPVDRTIDLGQLTGTWFDRVRQRVSLTIGVTLSAPSLAGRAVNAPFLGRYPVVALGFRMSSYSRVTAGTVLYHIADANPASAAHDVVAAPFVGVALDVDLIHLLTQAKL